MTESKKQPSKTESETQEENTSLDPRAIQKLLEGIDLANKRGAFSIQEAGMYAEAYMHAANVLSSISQSVEEQSKTKKTNGENS